MRRTTPPMASTENASVGPATPPKRRPWSRFVSGILLTAGVLALKLKALAFVVFDYLRNFAVNPFEGFGAVQNGVAGGPMLGSITTFAHRPPRKLVFMTFLVVMTVLRRKGDVIRIWPIGALRRRSGINPRGGG